MPSVLSCAGRAARWAADAIAGLRDADPAVPDTLNDRAQDCWRPLLAIAEQAGPVWTELERQAAMALSDALTGEAELSVELLSDVAKILNSPLANDHGDIVPSAWLREQLLTLEARPWADFKDGRPISAKRIASLLAGHDIAPASNGTRRGDDAWWSTPALHSA